MGGIDRLSRRGFLGGAAGGIGAALLPAAAGARGGEPRALPLRDEMRTDRQWEAFLARQDLRWGRIPAAWYEGPFLGNGRQATMAYKPAGRNALRFDVQHSEVQDHRPSRNGVTIDKARLPIGAFYLEPAGEITGVDLRLDLWNAELSGVVQTDRGELAIRVLVHAERDLMAATVTPSGGERATWTFEPDEAISPRTKTNGIPEGFQHNPPPERRTHDGVEVCVQDLLFGGQHATAWREAGAPFDPDGSTLVAVVAHSHPESTAESAAVASVAKAARTPASSLARGHRDWWHRYYRASFLSIPDPRLESFYWIQLYKVAAGTRADAPVLATTGPWLEPTGWPAIWWNLNVQLEYWLIHGSNHLELDAVTRSISEFRQTLVESVPEEYRSDSAGIRRSSDQFLYSGTVTLPGRPSAEIGNLTWALHNVWLTYRHTMDDELLRDTVFPILRRAVNFYLHFLSDGADGRLHLPLTFSPEYGDAPDCNYDLSLLRWGAATLLESCERLGISDPLQARWRDVLARLVDYPIDENGFMVGAGVPFAKSHRHYSHMLSVYPLYLVNWEQPEQRDLIERSLRHWIGFEGALQGYSFTGAASISAQMGRGDDAAAFLGELLRRFVQPNTMYREGASPVVETPLSGAQSVHDMLVQSWGGTIRVFPAVPAAWKDVVVHDFRTQGAFLVSAARRGGRTQFVRVRSLAGERCRLRPGLPGPYVVQASHGPKDAVEWRQEGDELVLELERDEEAVVYTAGTRPDLRIAPVAPNGKAEPWGLPPIPPPGESVPVDLGGRHDNDGISFDDARGDGNFDGSGYTYPGEEVPPAGPVTFHGIRFTFPSGAPGAANNLTLNGQTIEVPPGRYARLRMLGASTSGNREATATATYADGSTAPVELALSDWGRSAAFGELEALRTTHRHNAAGDSSLKVAIFHQRADLDPGRELRSITLPTVTDRPQMHLFALSLEKEPPA